MQRHSRFRPFAVFGLGSLIGLLCMALCALADPTVGEPGPELSPLKFTLSSAVHWSLEHNPQLATFRKNQGIAAAAVQIARQYPFNPIFQHFLWYDNGPHTAGITNHYFTENTARLDLELNRQGRYRRGMAHAALTRTEWEIAAQELLTSVQVARAFNNVLYRQAKYRILEEGLKLTESTANEVKTLVEAGALRTFESFLADADVVEARNGLAPAWGLVVVAENDLRRALGLVNESYELVGTLEKSVLPPPNEILIPAALERRPDLHALEFAVREADNRLRLEIANRWGNPSFGPAFEYNETSVFFVGSWLIWSPPVLNTRRGEIRQREAERARALQSLRQGEVLVQQDVYAALARLDQAEKAASFFRTQTFPKLFVARENLDKLYTAGQGVDLARVIDIRRRILRARDAYLDALFELSQAQVDLAAAVADVSFAGCLPPLPTGEGEKTSTPADQQKMQPPDGEQLPSPKPLPNGKKPQAAPGGEQLKPPVEVPKK